MLSRSIFKALLFAAMLLALAATAMAATPVDEAAPASAGSIHTYLAPDLTLKSTFSSALVLAGATGIGTKTCRCTCGQPCQTNADCGGNICAVGITCCAKSPEAKWFQDPAQSSRKTELPAFRGACN